MVCKCGPSLDDQWTRVRIALSLLATFVSESGYKKHQEEYKRLEDMDDFKRLFDCPRPPDFHELIGRFGWAMGAPIPVPDNPDPCPSPNLNWYKRLGEIERNHAGRCVTDSKDLCEQDVKLSKSSKGRELEKSGRGK